MEFINNYLPFIVTLGLLEFIIKPFALWRAARKNELYWFIAIVVLNTAGILPIIYLLLSNPKKKSK